MIERRKIKALVERELDRKQRTALVVAVHHREVDKVVGFLNRALIKPVLRLVVANFGPAPIPRPVGLDRAVSFEEIKVRRPGASNVVDPLSLLSATRTLSRINRTHKGIEVLFVTAQYGHRGVFFEAGQAFDSFHIIFVPEGTGVLEDDSFRYLTAIGAVRAYGGMIYDSLRRRRRGWVGDMSSVLARLFSLMVLRGGVFGGMLDSSERPTMHCDLLYSDWGTVTVPRVAARTMVGSRSCTSLIERQQVSGFLIVHAPVPSPDVLWALVIERLLELGVEHVYLAAHPITDGFDELVAAATGRGILQVTVLHDFYPLESHLDSFAYDGVVGFFSSILVYAGVNYPTQAVYCASKFVEERRPDVSSDLRRQRLALFSEILPRVEGCIVRDL